MRDELWMPELSSRQHRDIWQAEGSKDMAQRVGERTRQLAESHQAPPLPDEIVATLDRLKRQGAANLSKEGDKPGT
jgi:trimethylamine:corrinoid methyltransferase-like protein